MGSTESWDKTRARALVRKSVSQELQAGVPLPHDEIDLIKKGLIDSMGWVGILTAIEEATGIKNFASPWPEGRPQSIGSLVEAIDQAPRTPTGSGDTTNEGLLDTTIRRPSVSISGWGYALGSLRIEAAAVERECGLAAGTIRDRAGIESVCRADDHENEVTLGQRAAELALKAANLDPETVDMLVATSATFLSFPSLSSTLHTRLLLRESCAALDVGGACVGVVYALATARALLSTGRHRVGLVVASEVNSRRLSSTRIPGEFRGLFGDGACAFVLARSDSDEGHETLRLGDFICGCSATFASSLQLALRETGELDVQFKGEQLGKAALTQMAGVLDRLESLSGKPRAEVDYFAIHEPNPRLVEIFVHKAGIPSEKVALTSSTCGNLGSVTCGVSLCTALARSQDNRKAGHRPLIFIAAVGPGLVWGGGYLD